jgi:hypothetical protein
MRYARHVEYMTNIIDATLCREADTERRGRMLTLHTFLIHPPSISVFPKVHYAYHGWYAKEFHGVRGREGMEMAHWLASNKETKSSYSHAKASPP